MFKLEILELLKKFDKENSNQIKEKISSLIKNNEEEFEIFINEGFLDEKHIQILKDIVKIIEKEKTQKKSKNSTPQINQTENDINKINEIFFKYTELLKNNNNKVNEEIDKLIFDIVDFYFNNRLNVLLKIFEIKDSHEYEKFKNHIKNHIKSKIAKKVKDYMESENYLNLGFFKKKKKENELFDLLELNGTYKFKEINLEVLN
jgi:hypothetical protein